MSVRSAGRVLDLLEWLNQQKRPVSLAEARNALAVPKSSALLLLRTLVERGYVQRRDSGYMLARLPGEISPNQLAWNRLVRVASPILAETVNQIGESGFVAVLTEKFQIRYLTKLLPTAQELKYDRNIALDRVAHHVASGLAILAKMPDSLINEYLTRLSTAERKLATSGIAKTRRKGVAVNLVGRVEGAAGVGVAIVDARGRPVGAINLAGPAGRIKTNIKDVVAAAECVAGAIERELTRGMSKRAGQSS